MSDLIPFKAFDPYGEVHVYEHGDLPHWQQDGCTYFVTFRLADSLPQQVLRRLEERRLAWLHAHGIDGQQPTWKTELLSLSVAKQRAYEREFGNSYNRELDKCHGACVSRAPHLGKIVADALLHFHGERVYAGDFVVMPNHVHVLMTPLPSQGLQKILASIKGFTGREINQRLGRKGTLWQRQSYDHIVRDAEQLRAFQRYIAENPLKANLTDGFILHEAEYAVT